MDLLRIFPFVVVTRHTQTDDNAQKRYTGQLDVPLNDLGRIQARELTVKLCALNVVAVYCSDLIRSLETAQQIAKLHRQDPMVDPRLREVCLGELEGLNKDAARKRCRKHKSANTEIPDFDFSHFGGEVAHDVRERHEQFFRELAATPDRWSTPGACVVVVGHGTALRNYLENLGLPWDVKQGGYRILDTWPLPRTV